MSLDLKAIEEDWKRRGFTFDLWIDPPGQVWKDFRHNVDELLMVVEGELQLEMNGQVLYPKKGEEILIPANTLHTVSNIGKTTARWLYGYKKRG